MQIKYIAITFLVMLCVLGNSYFKPNINNQATRIQNVMTGFSLLRKQQFA